MKPVRSSETVFKACLFGLALVTASAAFAWEIPAPTNLYTNKLNEAWGGTRYAPDINDPPDTSLLPMDESELGTYRFDLAARNDVTQIKFWLKSVDYLLNNGIEPKDAWGKKTLGYAGLIMGYDYGVAPSYNEQGQFTRKDRYYIAPGFGLKTVLHRYATADVDLKAQPSYSIEMTFYREFADPKLAVLSVPYFHRNLPYNADHALAGLQPGELFTFKGQLNILTSASYVPDVPVAHLLSVNGGAFYLLSGGFEVFVLRLPDNHVRLKVVALRDKDLTLQTQLGFSGKYFLEKSTFVDKTLLHVLDPSIVDWSFTKGIHQSFTMDYILNLSDPDVQMAYNKSLQQLREFNYVQVVDHRISSAQVDVDLISNFQAIETLWQEDQANSVLDRVSKVEVGQDDSKFHKHVVQIGPRYAYLMPSKIDAKDNISITGNDGVKQNYVFEDHERKIDLSLFSNVKRWTREAIFATATSVDEHFQNPTPDSFTMSMEKDLQPLGGVKSDDLKDIKADLMATFPQYKDELAMPAISDQAPLQGVLVRSRAIFGAQALDLVTAERVSRLSEDLTAYVNQNLPSVNLYEDRSTTDKVEFEEISNVLPKVFVAGLSPAKRIGILAKLRNNGLFRKMGPGFLMSLLPKDRLEQLVRVHVSMSSTNHPHILDIQHGPRAKERLFLQLFNNDHNTNSDVDNYRLEQETAQAMGE